jgi:hypothetical protein
MLKPGHQKTHRAYIWSHCTTSYDALKAVVFDFAESRGGQHVRDFWACTARAARTPSTAAGAASSYVTTSRATTAASNWA